VREEIEVRERKTRCQWQNPQKRKRKRDKNSRFTKERTRGPGRGTLGKQDAGQAKGKGKVEARRKIGCKIGGGTARINPIKGGGKIKTTDQAKFRLRGENIQVAQSSFTTGKKNNKRVKGSRSRTGNRNGWVDEGGS